MLSMDHMESTVLDTALILWDMVMAILATVMDMVLAMAVMGMESAMLNQSLMLSMEPMVGMAMDLDTYILPGIWTWIRSWIWLWSWIWILWLINLKQQIRSGIIMTQSPLHAFWSKYISWFASEK